MGKITNRASSSLKGKPKILLLGLPTELGSNEAMSVIVLD
jgi:hypothetical protein